VRGYSLSLVRHPLTRFALDDASHRQEQIDLSPLGRGELDPGQVDSIKDHSSFRHLPLVVDDDFLAPVRAPMPIKKKQRGTCCAALLMTGGTLLCRLMPNRTQL
jgi:hypothetical protein